MQYTITVISSILQSHILADNVCIYSFSPFDSVLAVDIFDYPLLAAKRIEQPQMVNFVVICGGGEIRTADCYLVSGSLRSTYCS